MNTRALSILCLTLSLTAPWAATQAAESSSTTVYFSPEGGCTEAIVREIGRARKTILVQAYSFTSAPIAKALVDAHKRHIEVKVILDRSQKTEKYSSADFVLHAGIPTWIDAQHAIAHNKIMIIDGETILTGSFNFTKSAETSNAENLLVIKGYKDLVAKYTANWQQHLSHSDKYEDSGRDEPVKKIRKKKGWGLF